MADSNTAISQPAKQPTNFVSKVGSTIHEAYDFISTALLAAFHVLIQPYIFFWNLTKSFFEYGKDLIAIGTMSIRAVNLYLRVCLRFLTNLNKNNKPAETFMNKVKRIGTATNNYLQTLSSDPRSLSSRNEIKYPPIAEGNESEEESGNISESGSYINGQPSANGGSRSSDVDKNRPPGNSSGSNGSSNGGVNGGTGSDGAAPVNGSGKSKVTFDPNVKEAPADSNATTKPSSTSSTNQGVNEVDKSGKKTSSTPATYPTSGGGTAPQSSKV